MEDIAVSGGAYHPGNGNPYQYTFVDSALKKLADIGGGTLLVANAGWKDEQITAINQAASDAGVNLLWFSTIDSLSNYINNGGDGGRANDPITSFTVYAHGTDSDTGNYAITFGLYSDNDFRWYTGDLSRINKSAFASNSVSTFYACRTGNTFNNGNFAQTWANITDGETYAFSGLNGRSEYSDILGTLAERKGMGSNAFKAWKAARGNVDAKPGAAWRSPVASWKWGGGSMTFFYSANYQWSPAKPVGY